MVHYNIVAIPGDGIGPEIVREAKKVLDKVGEVYGHKFNYTDILMGGCSIDAYGVPLTDEALETARNSDAVLLGAVVAFLVDGLVDSTLVSSLYPTAIFFWMTASRYAYFLEQENTRTGHFKPGILCRLTDSLTAKIHQKG